MNESKTRLTKRQRDELIRSELIQIRNPYLPRWQDIIRHIMPDDGEFFGFQQDDVGRKDQAIYDSAGSVSLRTAENGLFSAVCSPAQRWFAVGVEGEDDDEYSDAATWSYKVEQKLYRVISNSNAYKVMPMIMRQYLGIGTACVLMEDDVDDIFRFHVFQVGSYMISQDAKGVVDTFARDFVLSVRACVDEYAIKGENGEVTNWENFSPSVRQAYELGEHIDTPCVEIFHIIRRNENYNPNSIFAKEKEWSSCYYERGHDGNRTGVGEQYLSESGYDYFPVLAPRWQTVGNRPYGVNSPGYMMLPEVKQLQEETIKLGLATDKLADPPTIASTSLKTAHYSTLPGKVTWTDDREAVARPIYTVDPKVTDLRENIRDIKKSIQKICYEDLFLMFATSDRREFTAAEVHERKSEKYIGLGSPVGNLDKDFLKPWIENLFIRLYNLGMIEKAPESVQGKPLRIRHISSISQAQSAEGVGAMDRFLSFAERVVKAMPSAASKFNAPQALDVYARRLDIPPGVVRSDEETAAIDEANNAAAAQQARVEQMALMAKGASDLAGADTEGKNALTDIAGAMGQRGAA